MPWSCRDRVLAGGRQDVVPGGVAADWIGRRTAGEVETVLVSCKGTGSYGARLAKTLLEVCCVPGSVEVLVQPGFRGVEIGWILMPR